MLIGITAPHTPATQLITTTVTELLNLIHISMRTPAINALAAMIERDAQEIIHSIDPNTMADPFGKTIFELEKSIDAMLRSGDEKCFINYTAGVLDTMKKNRTYNALFSGHIITGIKTDVEADWLRKQGGLLLHIYDYRQTPHNYIDEHEGDLQINAEKAGTHELATIISAIETAQKAAA